MAQVKDVIAGLEVVMEVVGENSLMAGAEHDVLYGLPPNTRLTNEQKQKLEAAGWMYSNNEGWYHFV